MRRREFITLLGGAAAWPLAARAQQPAMPVVGFLTHRVGRCLRALLWPRSAKASTKPAMSKARTSTVEYHWLGGQYDRLPALMADLVRRHVAVIAAPGTSQAALAAKAATATIPIVFGVGEDPVQLGLVASLARPGGNVTGINYFVDEVVAKRLRLLHDLVPKAVRIAVLVNPANLRPPSSHCRPCRKPPPPRAANPDLQRHDDRRDRCGVCHFARERPDALFVAPDAFFASRRGQFATLTARDRIPAAYATVNLWRPAG